MRIASRVYPALILVALAILLTACGTSSSPTGAALAATAVPTATATTAATPTVTVNAASLPSTCTDVPSGSRSLVHIGNLVFTQAAPALAYPSYQLPGGIPLKPLKVPSESGDPNPGSLPANPGGAYILAICNTSSSQHHTVQSLSARLSSFAAYSGQLNAWNPCITAYNTQTGSAGGGCGGGYVVNESVRATFPASSAVGTTVVAAQTGSANPQDPTKPFPPLPLALAPGQSISIAVTLVAPKTPGTYTFSIGISVDATAPTFISTTAAALYAPVAHEWDGQACTTPTMKAQIPVSSTPAYYVCPKS